LYFIVVLTGYLVVASIIGDIRYDAVVAFFDYADFVRDFFYTLSLPFSGLARDLATLVDARSHAIAYGGSANTLETLVSSILRTLFSAFAFGFVIRPFTTVIRFSTKNVVFQWIGWLICYVCAAIICVAFINLVNALLIDTANTIVSFMLQFIMVAIISAIWYFVNRKASSANFIRTFMWIYKIFTPVISLLITYIAIEMFTLFLIISNIEAAAVVAIIWVILASIIRHLQKTFVTISLDASHHT